MTDGKSTNSLLENAVAFLRETECRACNLCDCKWRFTEKEYVSRPPRRDVKCILLKVFLLLGIFFWPAGFLGLWEISARLRSWRDYRSVAPPLEISANGTACGKTYTIGGRNSGYESINYGDSPWQAVISSSSAKNRLAIFRFSRICEGSLISERFVLTTAHCALGFPLSSSLTVRLGEHDLILNNERYKHQEFDVRRIIVHEEYKVKGDINDIALLELAENVVFNKAVAPICLLRIQVAKRGQLASQSGWDLPGHGGIRDHVSLLWDQPRDLTKFDVQLTDCRAMNPQQCATTDGSDNSNFFDDSSSLCGVPLGIATKDWSSNSGAPLLQYRNGRAELIGITSIFYKEPMFHIKYTNIASHSSWIDSNMELSL